MEMRRRDGTCGSKSSDRTSQDPLSPAEHTSFPAPELGRLLPLARELH